MSAVSAKVVGGGGSDVGGGGKGKHLGSAFGGAASSSAKPKSTTIDVGELLRSCRVPVDRKREDWDGYGASTSGVDRQVDAMDDHLAIAANSGFAVYVLSLSEQTRGDARDPSNIRILSRHEFSQVKALRFARTRSSDAFGLSLVSLAVIQEDGEIAVWSYRSKWRQEGFLSEGSARGTGNGRWQLVNRIPPAQGRCELASHAVLTWQSRLTVLCLNRRTDDVRRGGADALAGRRCALERIDLEMCGSLEEGDGGDLSPRHRKRAVRSRLGEVAGADLLLCPPPASIARDAEDFTTRFWVVCSRRSLAFLWDLGQARCVRKVGLARQAPLGLCCHNPSGALLWITDRNEVWVHRSGGGRGEGSTAGGRILSRLDPAPLSDQRVERVVSVGPFLWVAATPITAKLRQGPAHRQATALCFHAASGTCVGKQALNPPRAEQGGGSSSATGRPHLCLVVQEGSLGAYLATAGGPDAGTVWKLQLKVPAAMSAVLEGILSRLGGGRPALAEAGGTPGPTARQDLDLLSSVVGGELSRWGGALHSQRLDARLAQVEVLAKLGTLEELGGVLDETAAAPALAVRSRMVRSDLERVLGLLVDRAGGKEGGAKVPGALPDPQRAVDENTRRILCEFSDRLGRLKEAEGAGEGAWGSPLFAMGSSDGGSYLEGDRFRLCLYFFRALLAAAAKGPGCAATAEANEAFAWLACNLGDEGALDTLKRRVDQNLVEGLALELAGLGDVDRGAAAADADDRLCLEVAFEVACLMLYLAVPGRLVGFVLAYAAAAEGREGGGQGERATRGYAFRAACVLPALHVRGRYELPPPGVLETQIETQAELMVCAGHPLCALHVLCRLEHSQRGDLNEDSFAKINRLLTWMRGTRIVGDGSEDDLEVLSILVEHVVMMMLRGGQGRGLSAEAATLLRTLSRGGEAEEGEVVESVIKEAISSLHSAIL